MSKISPVSIKYIIRARFYAEGVVEKPDVIGAIFGQTEGLLGEDLELRELQKSGKIGRIEVSLETEKGVTQGIIEIPTSLDKAETALLAAALETIERVGPSEATIKVETIEDVRASKREYVMERAKRLLKDFQEKELPETAEIKSTMMDTMRMMDVTEYGRERLPAGPDVDVADEIIIVEGRADVLNLLKCGIKNVIALNGTSVPETIRELCRERVATLFVDGDRGGILIAKDVTSSCDITYIARAPDGKEVEELTKKEVFKALRDKVEGRREGRARERENEPLVREVRDVGREFPRRREEREGREYERRFSRKRISKREEELFSKMFEDIIGTRGAYLFDENLEILGKVPISELPSTLQNIRAYALVADGIVTSQIAGAAEHAGVEIVVAKDFASRGNFKALTFKEISRV